MPFKLGQKWEENKWGRNWVWLGEGKLDCPLTTHWHFVWAECWGGADQERDGDDDVDNDEVVEMTNMVDEVFED